MRQPFDEIGSPVPFGGALVIPQNLTVGEVQQRPEVHERTHRQHEHARIGLIGDWHGRDAHVVGIERVNVVGRRYMTEDKGHGRIEIALARRDAVPHYAMEIGTRVIADAVLFVRCDVGRIERTERRRYRQTASSHRPLRHRVATEAVSRQGQLAATRDQGLHPFGRKSLLRLRSYA